jgi:SpoVK/Ycf46/Vps4 family AAA+-type ATPase
VILFDEIEEFCLDRETPGLGMESRMLTTAMLTAINDLRRAERSIFFLATNRLRAFDSAIIRPGRFDMQLFVGTPNLEARVVLLNQRLASVPLSSEEKHIVVDKYTRYLEFVWTENAMFMNYLESKQYANAIGDIVASGSQLTEDEMSSILNAQAAVMTVRGPVRDEYIASMDLSRQ